MSFIVSITDMTNTRQISVNGEGATRRSVIADFMEHALGADVSGDAVEQFVAGKSVNVVNAGPVTAANLDQPITGAAVVTVYSQGIADGAVKGAVANAS